MRREKVMGVYINMEMPSCCMFCPLSNSCGCGLTNPPVLMTSKEMLADRPDWCPLVPVPPHGRLIDADEYKKWLPSIENEYKYARKLLDSMPTIIPPEEEET